MQVYWGVGEVLCWCLGLFVVFIDGKEAGHLLGVCWVFTKYLLLFVGFLEINSCFYGCLWLFVPV